MFYSNKNAFDKNVLQCRKRGLSFSPRWVVCLLSGWRWEQASLHSSTFAKLSADAYCILASWNGSLINAKNSYTMRFLGRCSCNVPAKVSSSVDFPEPLGPMIAIMEPGSAYPVRPSRLHEIGLIESTSCACFNCHSKPTSHFLWPEGKKLLVASIDNLLKFPLTRTTGSTCTKSKNAMPTEWKNLFVPDSCK